MFLKKNLKIDILKIKNIVKFEIILIIQENIEVIHISYVILKYNVPKKTPIVFHNGPNYDYYFIIKELAEEFKQLFTCSGEKTEKYIPLQFQQKNKLQELIKMEKKLRKIYLTLYGSLVAQD